MSAEKEKMTAKKLVNLPPTLMGRLKRTASVARIDESEIIRRGLTKELDRMEADASVEATRMQKLRALAAARGCDVDEVIEEMLRNAQEPQLPLATTDTAA